MEPKLTQLIDKALSRRSFMAGAGAATAATLVTGCGGPGATTPTATPTTTTYTDTDYLNFALNLEYLEAEFYLHAATGSGLSASDSGNATSKTVVASTTKIPSLTAQQSAYLNEIAQNELDHVRFLRSALGSAAVAAPAIDLMTSFNTAAAAAKIGNTFNPFSSYTNYLLGAFIFEDVGVTAYHGAAVNLTSKTILGYAARIHAVEAYHAASIRAQIVMMDSTATPLIAPANDIVSLRATLGSDQETMVSATTIVAATGGTSIGFGRSTDQVLHIVYGTGGGAGVKSGLFFPSGLAGNISATNS